MRPSLITVALLIGGTSAFAQSPSVPSADLPKEYTFVVSPEDVATIGQALGKLSYDAVAPLMGKLSQQLQQQQSAARKAGASPVPGAPAPGPGPHPPGVPAPKLPLAGEPK